MKRGANGNKKNLRIDSRTGPEENVMMMRMRWTLFVIGMLLASPGVALAQQRPSAAIDLEGGWVGFADDGIVGEALVGGAGRWYVSPRIAIGPELVYLSGSNHSHLVLTGNLTIDLRRPINRQPRVITPFIVVGGGLFQTREEFFGVSFRSNEGAFTAGGGVRVAAGDRVTVGIDARFGWEPHIRLTGLVGIRVGS